MVNYVISIVNLEIWLSHHFFFINAHRNGKTANLQGNPWSLGISMHTASVMQHEWVSTIFYIHGFYIDIWKHIISMINKNGNFINTKA